MFYRDFKLTFLFKDAFGGRARCTFFACVSLVYVNVEEIMFMLKFV